MKKRLLSLGLVFLLLISALPLPAFALEEPGDVAYSVITEVNPLYPGAVQTLAPPEDAGEPEDGLWTQDAYISVEEAAARLRQTMVLRLDRITLNVDVGQTLSTDGSGMTLNLWIRQVLFPAAYGYDDARTPYEGDYLRWSWKQWRLDSSTLDNRRYTLRFQLEYYTTAEQEEYVAGRVEELSRSLNLAGRSPLEAYTAIYEYITANVRYDYDAAAAARDSDPNNDSEYDPSFSAYGALANGEAVCEGYATLYYALCRSANLPVRCLTNQSHIWNIVYLKDMWYELDATWDSLNTEQHIWFLRGRDTFETTANHRPRADYWDDAFFAEYPVSRWDYDPDIPFSDVPRSNYHYGNILRAWELSLFNGTSAYRFSPSMNISRAMLVTVLWRMEGSPAGSGGGGFSDVPAGMYYTTAVAWAAANGIVQGRDGNRFDPDGDCTRQELVTFLYRYIRYLGRMTQGSAKVGRYTDWETVADWAKTPMAWAVDNQIVNGTTDTTLSPLDNASREQLATILIRMIDRYELPVGG